MTDLIARIEAAQPSDARELFEEELRPCPFCGGEALAHFPKSDFAGTWIECQTCRAKVTRYVKPEAAVAKWNTRATDAENQRLRAEVEALREDCRKLLENEPVATCESCGTWLLDGDDYVTDPDGVAGCWASMTDVPSKTERQCYAYRVGKCDARTALIRKAPQ